MLVSGQWLALGTSSYLTLNELIKTTADDTLKFFRENKTWHFM